MILFYAKEEAVDTGKTSFGLKLPDIYSMINKYS